MAEANIQALFGEDFRIYNVFYVAKNGDDANIGTEVDPFLTIQAAIDAAVASGVVSSGERAVIEVAPGIYTEQIKSYQGIYINGIIQNVSTSEGGAVVIYNTGVDAAHYPLCGDDGYDFWLKNLTVQTDAGGVFGNLSNSRFNSILFQGGEFIERLEDKALYAIWENCSFISCTAFNLTGVAPQGRYLVFNSCWFGWWKTMKFESTHTIGNAVFDMNEGFLAFTQLNLKGDWYHFAKNYHSFGASRHEFDTTKGISYRHVTISNGIHFVSAPMNFQMIGCEMTDAAEMPLPDNEADITADVVIPDCVFVNNTMHNGISGKIQLRSYNRNVGVDTVNRYFSIQDAIDSLPDGGMVFIDPGIYTEQIHSFANIIIQGRTHEGPPALKQTVLYNTGVDALHYPLRGEDEDIFVINDITIKTDPGEVIGKLSASSFSGVVFEKGHFIEATADQALLMGLSSCSFKDSKAFNLEGTGSGGLRALTINNCFFGNHSTHATFDSTHMSTLAIVKNTIFHNFYPDIGGNWVAEFSNCHIFGSSRTVISTTGKISLVQCILSNGLHFTSNPSTIIHLCTFNDGCGPLITGDDITAAVTVTDTNYAQNVQQNGINGLIQILAPVKNVGQYSVDCYATIQDAITSVPASSTAVIRVFDNYTGLSKLVLPAIGTQITLDGSKKYSLAFADGIVDITGSQKFGFIDAVDITGGAINLNGSTAELSLESCQSITANLTIDNGTSLTICRSALFGTTGAPTVTINSLLTFLLVGYSLIQGASGQPAIDFTVEADNKLKAKFSTFIHGDGGTNAPMTYVGANKIDYAMYSSALNSSLNTAKFNNTIVNSNNTTSGEIDF